MPDFSQTQALCGILQAFNSTRGGYMNLVGISQRPHEPDIRRLRREYRILCELQLPLERLFWQLEQRKGQLIDQLANLGVAPFCFPRKRAVSVKPRKEHIA
jgi:hypothetical protein